MVQIISSFCKYFLQSSSTEVPFSSEPCWHSALHPRNCHLLGMAWAMAKWSQFLSVSPKSEWWNCYRDVACWGQQSSSSLLLLLQFEEKFSAMVPSKRPTMQGEQGERARVCECRNSSSSQIPSPGWWVLSVTIGLMKPRLWPLEVQDPHGTCSVFAFKVTSQNMKLVRRTVEVSCWN